MIDHTERGVTPRARLKPPSIREQLLGGLISRDELADALGCTWRTIYSYLQQGLPSVRVGARRYYHIEKVRAWIETQDPRRLPRRIGRPRGSFSKPK